MVDISDTLIRLGLNRGRQKGYYDDYFLVLTSTRDKHMALARYRRDMGQQDRVAHYVRIALSAHFRAMRSWHRRDYRKIGQPYCGFGMQYGIKAASERL